MKALIETYNNNRIAQVEPDDRIFQVVPSLRWVDCPEYCQTDWSYHNGQFIRPEVSAMTIGMTLQDTLSSQTQNMVSEISAGQKDESISSRSNVMNINSIHITETGDDVAWRDSICMKCYELMDIVRSEDMKMPLQEELLVMLSVLKWLREFAEGKTAN